MDKIHASFIVAKLPDGNFAGTTRATDRGESDRVGLPGGKLDAGEDARAAAIREAQEEGWSVHGVAIHPFHIATVEGRAVAWFAAKGAAPLSSYKEIGRIEPISLSFEDVVASGYGNDRAIAAWMLL